MDNLDNIDRSMCPMAMMTTVFLHADEPKACWMPFQAADALTVTTKLIASAPSTIFLAIWIPA